MTPPPKPVSSESDGGGVRQRREPVDGPMAILARREIEAELLAPVAAVLAQELGPARAAELLARAIGEIAFRRGRDLRGVLPAGLAGVATLWRSLAEGGALDLEIAEGEALRVRVSRCGYAEMYRRKGIEALGRILSCGRDEPLLRGFSDKLRLRRTRCLLEGDDCCELTYTEGL